MLPIIFTDLSEVLIHGVFGIEERIEHYYGDSVAMKFAKRKDELRKPFRELMRGCMTEDQFWDLFLSRGNWPFGVQEIKKLFSANLAEEIPGTFETYSSITKYPASLKNSNKKRIDGRPEFWLISDHIKEREEELLSLHPEIFQFCSRHIWSYDEVAIKKDPAFFHRLVKKNNLDPEEILFIDDDIDNITAASEVGIHTLWFRNYLHMKYVLRRQGFGFTKPES